MAKPVCQKKKCQNLCSSNDQRNDKRKERVVVDLEGSQSKNNDQIKVNEAATIEKGNKHQSISKSTSDDGNQNMQVIQSWSYVNNLIHLPIRSAQFTWLERCGSY
jgi:hypothetical protein